MTQTEIDSSVLAFVQDQRPDLTIELDTELIETGVVDSIALIKTIQFLEATFSIAIPDADIDPDMFASARSIARYVAARTGVSEAAPADKVPAE